MTALDCSVNGADRDLCEIGQSIAQMNGYKHVNEREAINRYLIDKYNWLPSQVRELTKEDLFMLLDGFNKVVIMP